MIEALSDALDSLISHHEGEMEVTEGREYIIHSLRSADMRNKITMLMYCPDHDVVDFVREEVKKYLEDDLYLGRHDYCLVEWDEEQQAKKQD